ncbi:MAG: type II toxin-antitoxin system PemK/MazF family toxin [Bacteroidales bacterium]
MPEGKSGLEKESLALCHQIRTIDKKRLSKKYGQIQDKNTQNKTIEALCFQLGISYDKSTQPLTR